MFLRQIFLCFIGLCAGLFVSNGVFTVLTAVGVVTRFAGKTHTGKYVRIYESVICAGTIIGCIWTVFAKYLHVGEWIRMNALTFVNVWNVIGNIIVVIWALFAGMFVGCLAVAIAEMLDAIPIMVRRVSFRHGLGFAVLAIALGKLVGSLIYFSQHVFLYGG